MSGALSNTTRERLRMDIDTLEERARALDDTLAEEAAASGLPQHRSALAVPVGTPEALPSFAEIASAMLHTSRRAMKERTAVLERLAVLEYEVGALMHEPFAEFVQLESGQKIPMANGLPRAELVAQKLTEVADCRDELEAIGRREKEELARDGAATGLRLKSLLARQVGPRVPKQLEVERELERGVREIAEAQIAPAVSDLDEETMRSMIRPKLFGIWRR